MVSQRRYSRSTDRFMGIILDQTLLLLGYQSAKDYPAQFRGIRHKDPKHGERLLYVRDNAALTGLNISSLHQAKWQGELFSLDKNGFARTDLLWNIGKRVKSQIWIAVSVYMLVAIIRWRLNLTRSLYKMWQRLCLNLFKKTSLRIALGVFRGPRITSRRQVVDSTLHGHIFRQSK